MESQDRMPYSTMTYGERIKKLEDALIELAARVASEKATGIDVIRAYRFATGSTLGDSKRWYDALKLATTDPEPTAIERLEKRVEALERAKDDLDREKMFKRLDGVS